MIPVNKDNSAETAKVLKDGAVVGPATVRRSPSIAKLAAALCAAQADFKSPAKKKQNPHLKNWYADLPAVLDAVLPALNANRLCVTQFPCELDGQPALQTLLLHDSGEWVETTALLRPVKTDPQSIGSAQSYARRYALLALCGVAPEDDAADDDGHAASRPAREPEPAPNDDLRRRAGWAQKLAATMSPAECDRVAEEIRADPALGPGDRKALGPLWQEAKARSKAAVPSA